MFAKKLRTSSSHEEGCERLWSINTKIFQGKEGKLETLKAVKLDWTQLPDGRWQSREIPGTEFEITADLVLLAMGFVHGEHGALVKDLEIFINFQITSGIQVNFQILN